MTDMKRLEDIENSLGAGDYHREKDVEWIISRLRAVEAENERLKQTAWLLESVYQGKTVWLCSGDSFLGCTSNANEAIRFSRREDAEGFIKHHDLRSIGTSHLWFASEHIWMATLDAEE